MERVSGSGVIIDPRGLILTNSHVVFGRAVIIVDARRRDDGPGRASGGGPALRHRLDPDSDAERRQAAGRGSRRFRSCAGGRGSVCDRQSARLEPHAHPRHRLGGQPPAPECGVVDQRAAHPDRRRDQSWQLRRPALRSLRPGDRHHDGDPAERPEHRLRDPVEPDQDGDAAAPDQRATRSGPGSASRDNSSRRR